MQKFTVYATATATICLGEFEAEGPGSAMAAAEKAFEGGPIACHQCAEEFDLGDFEIKEAELAE